MPGDDGFEFCRKVRSHSLIRQTPLLFLSAGTTRRRATRGWSWARMTSSPRRRPSASCSSGSSSPSSGTWGWAAGAHPGPGMEGQLEVMGAPGVLQMCHLTRLTGVLMVESGTRWMTIRFREGEIVGASGDENEQGANAVYAFLAWEEGRFNFSPRRPAW